MQSGKERNGPRTGRSSPRTSTSRSSTRSAGGPSTSSPSSRGGKTGGLCPVCHKGRLHRGMAKEEMFGFNLGTYPAEICDACGEHFIDLENFKRTEADRKSTRLNSSHGSISYAVF